MSEAMVPSRDPRVTLPDLLEVLLDRGVYLNLDLIITVADIPLVGVNLRATLAGLETMLEYGMMRSWDERTRAWVRNSVARDMPLADGEEIVAKMAGGHHLDDDLHTTWRPGYLYLTTHRLIAFRRDPRELLWSTRLEDVASVVLRREPTLDGDRLRVQVTTDDGASALLSCAAPDRLLDLLAARGVAGVSRDVVSPVPDDALVFEGSLWFLEHRAVDTVWRGGTGVLDRVEGLTWRGALDRRPTLRLPPAHLLGVGVDHADGPVAGGGVITVDTPDGVVRLAGDDEARWVRELDAMAARGHPCRRREVDDDAQGR